ncbi:MAG: enoyl-CoA hydratase/isomerase family protein [Myxococcales bacterium]|nr:enoyl-CoA hydratase/isomerase family protein [Myxococcales bacterium]MCB9520261.1 enoyl-CoA hydratase/isomerase family protein [Myxococcales bacterium]MCB9531371.1 enoyl-CoA hydratase/isomerase family protein [Myxococcales bacterium]MCB9533556.1 enoyl-CoA hydratase/isomerase family protein [Myxococcales bacterium]
MIDLQLTDDGVATLTLQAPPCNEIGLPMLQALEAALDRVQAAPGVRALVIASGQRGGFSAGADLRALYAHIEGRGADEWRGDLRGFIERIHALMSRLDGLPITTVAAIHGVCFGGGLELALVCDVRIAERSARFAFPELRLGLVPGFGGVPRLRRDVGGAVVRDLLLTGRSLNAKRALEVGLVAQMVPPGRGLEVAVATARQAALHDPETVAAAKAFAKPALEDELRAERELFLRLFERPVVAQALATFCASTDVRPYLATR